MQERIFEQFESVGHTVFLEISPLHMEIQYKFSDTNSEKKKEKIVDMHFKDYGILGIKCPSQCLSTIFSFHWTRSL